MLIRIMDDIILVPKSMNNNTQINQSEIKTDRKTIDTLQKLIEEEKMSKSKDTKKEDKKKPLKTQKEKKQEKLEKKKTK